MPASRSRDEDTQPEQVASGTLRDAHSEIDDSNSTRLALLHQAELQRPEGARRSVLEDVQRRRAHLDKLAIDSNEGITRTHEDMLHFATLRGVDYSLVRATFDFLGRQRVSEQDLDEALAHVSHREV